MKRLVALAVLVIAIASVAAIGTAPRADAMPNECQLVTPKVCMKVQTFASWGGRTCVWVSFWDENGEIIYDYIECY